MQNLSEIPSAQIARLDYSYWGSVGGYVSLSRVEVKDLSTLGSLWRLPEQMVFNFGQETLDSEDVALLKSRLTVPNDTGNDCSIPSWVDITYTEPIYLHVDGVGTRRSRTFFLRKNSPVFYLLVGGD